MTAGRKYAIQQRVTADTVGSRTWHERAYLRCLAEASIRALLALSGLPASAVSPWYDVKRAVLYARKLVALRKRANRRRMARGLQPVCTLCGALALYDNDDKPKHAAGSDTTHKARI